MIAELRDAPLGMAPSQYDWGMRSSPDRGRDVDPVQSQTLQDPQARGGAATETLARASARFDPTASSVLRALRDRMGLDTWIVVHRVDDEWRILRALRGGSEVGGSDREAAGSCIAALLERSGGLSGPVLAPRVREAAGLEELVAYGVGAYAAVPLRDGAGEVVGALCGADEGEQGDDFHGHLPFLTLVGELLGAILVAELHAAAADLRAEAATVQSLRDPLTGLGNRRLWDRLLVSEEERCRRHGTPATIVVVDVDGLKEVNDIGGHAAGDELLQRAARALRDLTRAPDVVTRTGGDEFAMVAVDCGEPEAPGVVTRLRASLDDRGVDASVGYAVREDLDGLGGAWARADAAMYHDKQARRTDPA